MYGKHQTGLRGLENNITVMSKEPWRYELGNRQPGKINEVGNQSRKAIAIVLWHKLYNMIPTKRFGANFEIFLSIVRFWSIFQNCFCQF